MTVRYLEVNFTAMVNNSLTVCSLSEPVFMRKFLKNRHSNTEHNVSLLLQTV